MKKSISIVILFVIFFSCQNNAQNNKSQDVSALEPVEVPLQDGLARAYFASGCFWCVEAIYESVKGVEEVINGYSGGHTKNPTYEASNTGITGHAESVEVIYDPEKVTFSQLLDVYFNSQNPAQVNGQGPDFGSQYRSIVFYQNEEQKQTALAKKEEYTKKFNVKIAAEIVPFQKFWKAEDYHQNYEKRNPNNPYIKNVSQKRVEQFKLSCPLLVKGTTKEVIDQINNAEN
ncbi:peptide-methionine (S)-S-oxide reductase MsrA [Yeosuana sp. MJ-SS3]|uniref:Peptide methionine sulfoxide reductase MsrA n=1 Tax=Gilvirhabdus luticola TaxID=3079858 RepID=A0ABU3U4E9_9FLAO|nr:peptide-methionine (S)-S-oxide reductase MsrA [Yeosuana sp. MJ-SS3]MDU8885292.1 peptide-methionine (S)-S-oxide reductase MsrA [Yeosuana sp. MJ-SS3]